MKKIAYIFLETEGVEICVKEKKKSEKIFIQYFPLNLKNNNKTSSINEISESICDKIIDIEKNHKIDELAFVFQDENIIFKEINVEKGTRKKEIEYILNSDITTYGRGIVDDYEITYKKYFNEDKGKKKVRVCLFPKYNMEIAEKISLNTKKKCKKIYAKYEIIEKCIKVDKVRKDILEFRNSDMVLYVVGKYKTESTMIIKKGSEDEEFIKYIAETNLSVIPNTNIKNANSIQNIISLEKNVETIPKEEILNVVENTKGVTNYEEKTDSRKSFKRMMRFMWIILAVSVIYSSRYFVENKCLKDELQREIGEKNITVNTEKKDLVPGYKHIYGVNPQIIENIISENPNEIQSINAEQHMLEAELISKNMNEINKIMSNPLYKKIKIEYIKSEEMDGKEAQQTYWIGDCNEESNSKTGQEKDNKEKTEEKSNQDYKAKRNEENNQKESNQANKSNKKEKINQVERWKEANKKEKNSIFWWKKESKENQKNKIAQTIKKNLKSYAAEEEPIEEVETNNSEENSGLSGGYVENSDKLYENKEENDSNNPQVDKKSGSSKIKKVEKTTKKSEIIKVYFIKIKAII